MSYINKEYWDNFYKENIDLNDESMFSHYIYQKFNKKQSEYLIIDLGCGTGKDSFYFAKNGFDVIGVDGSEEAIKINKNKISNQNKINEKIEFICADLSKVHIVSELMKNFNTYSKKMNKKILFYNRFFLHAVAEDTENIIFDSIISNIDVPVVFAAEFRTKEDEMLDKVFKDHFRRYVDTDKLLIKLISYGYSVQSFLKSRGLSKFKNEDPFLARLIVEKQ